MTAFSSMPSSFFSMHIGNDAFWARLMSYWVETTARATRGESRIYLATDIPESALDITNFARRSLFLFQPDLSKYTFDLTYHDGANARAFEELCFLRWFVARDIVRSEGLHDICMLDNDILLSSYADNISSLGGVPRGSSAFSAVEATAAFAATISEAGLNSFVENTEAFFASCQDHNVRRASDMQYISWLARLGHVDFMDTSENSSLQDGRDFIANFRRFVVHNVPALGGDAGFGGDHHSVTFEHCLRYWPSSALQKIFPRNPEGGLTFNKRPMQFIHFQGLAKAAYSHPDNNFFQYILESFSEE